MKIIDSTALMTVIDLVIMAGALVSLRALYTLRSRIGGGSMLGPLAVTSGFVLIAVFFAVDLATMWILPGWIGAERSHALMMDLHVNWSWLVMLAAAIALTVGILRTADGLARAHQKVQDTDALYRSVVEGQNDYIVRWLPDGTRTFVNDAYCRYREASPEDLLGGDLYDLIAPEDLEEVRKKGESFTPENPTAVGTHRSIAPDGTPRWQEWSDRAIFDKAGRLVEVQSVGRDVTERLRIERELKARDQQYEAIFRTSVNGVTVRSIDNGELLQVNPAMAAMFGYSVEEFRELRASDYVHPDSLPLYPKMLAAVRAGKRFPFEAKGIHRDGSELELEGHFIPFVFEGKGQILGLIQDATVRNCAARALRDSETRFRALFEASPDAILVTSAGGRILDSNPAASQLHGRSAEELAGCDYSDMVAEEDRPVLVEYLGQLATSGGVRVECLVNGADRDRVPVSLRACRFNYSDRPAVLFQLTDLTMQRKLEDQLRQSQKMEAVGRLAGGVAHDFNNLLTAILGYAELAESDLSSDRLASEDLGEIRRAAEKAARLTHQLLAFSRQQVLEPKVLDLNEVVVDMERLCRRSIGDDIDLSLELDPQLGCVKADRGQIEQVILNLAINARDAMPKGGRLIFETENVVLQDEYVTHEVLVAPGSYVGLTISDTGCGMSGEVRARVFEPFFTTKRPEDGTGLGLATVYGIVKQSGGFIWVYSEPGKGTSFKILMPRLQGRHAGREPEQDAVPISEGGSEILVVDDSDAVRSVTERVLRAQGHRVRTTRSAVDALRLSREHPRGFHLVLTDFALPDHDGLELAREIVRYRPETRVVLMSGYSKKLSFRSDCDSFVPQFLQKPFVKRDLLTTVARALSTSDDNAPYQELARAN